MKAIWKHPILLLALAFALSAATSFADVPGAHPGYLHALSDLRYARALLEQDAPNVVEHDQHWALHEIDEAIRVIKDAASEDGKDLNLHPPVQPQWPVSGRFHRALEAIGNAHRDVADREHNESARGLRDEAVHHIDEAHRAVEHAIQTASWSH
ncbi:MAG: hypothetical protein WBX22_24915 [Silvibacterium sp.]